MSSIIVGNQKNGERSQHGEIGSPIPGVVETFRNAYRWSTCLHTVSSPPVRHLQMMSMYGTRVSNDLVGK